MKTNLITFKLFFFFNLRKKILFIKLPKKSLKIFSLGPVAQKKYFCYRVEHHLNIFKCLVQDN